MVERLKDDEDRALETLFRGEAIPDNGFSRRVMNRIRTRLWLRRLALPIAALLGMAFALRPTLELVALLAAVTGPVQSEVIGTLTAYVPEVQFGVIGGLLVVTAITLFRFLEE